MDRVLTSGSPGGVRANTQGENAREVGYISALDAIFPIFINPNDKNNIGIAFQNASHDWLSSIPSCQRPGSIIEYTNRPSLVCP